MILEEVQTALFCVRALGNIVLCGYEWRQHAQQCKTRLPRDTAPNKSLLDLVISLNIFRAVLKRDTIFVTDLLHCTEGVTVSRVI